MGLAPHLRAGEAALRPLERLMRTSAVDEAASDLGALSGHVVIAGFGVAGRLLAHAAGEAGIPLIVLDVNAERVREARESGAPVYYGDVTSEEALRHAGVEHAHVVVLLLNDPDALRRAVAAARELSPQVFILARSRYLVEQETLARLGADLVVYEELEAGLEVATRVLRRFDVGPAELQAFVDAALTAAGHAGVRGELEACWPSQRNEPPSRLIDRRTARASPPSGARASRAARRFRVSRPTVGKWVRRYQEAGTSGRRPRRTPPELERRICSVRRRQGFGPHRSAGRWGSPLHGLRRAPALRSQPSRPPASRDQRERALRTRSPVTCCTWT